MKNIIYILELKVPFDNNFEENGAKNITNY